MIVSGRNIATDELVSIEFERNIRAVVELDSEPVQPGTEFESETGGIFLAPGFVDLQVNGFGGVDFNASQITTADVRKALEAMFATGVTRCLPTVITGSPEAMLTCLTNLHNARKELNIGGAIAGFHVEGPHIGGDDGPRGAHPKEWVRRPDLAEFESWQKATDGGIRLVTISPHWDNAGDYIRELVSQDVAVSVGHTGADSQQIGDAVKAGATLSTHLGNAAYKMLPKFPNCLWEQLAEDRLNASFIVDNLHLDRSYLRVAIRAKTVQRTILVTDAAAPAGARPGAYKLGQLDVELHPDDRVTLAGNDRLAGSALRMNKAISNLVESGEVSMRDSIMTATVNPARLISLKDRMRGLAVGEAADIVVFRQTPELVIEGVYLEGVRVI